jgi:hypothetical protein
MPIRTSHALQGSDSQDRSIGPRRIRGDPGGRRQAIRFPAQLPVRYQVGAECGWGEIVNISSRGILFATDRALALGARVAVYIKWPVLLHNSVQLSLIVSGRIVRVEPGRASLAIDRHEFRTCVPSFFRRSQLRLLPGRPPSAPQSREISKSSRQRNVEVNNARWERVFQEKFADPGYYRSRALPHSSPNVGD